MEFLCWCSLILYVFLYWMHAATRLTNAQRAKNESMGHRDVRQSEWSGGRRGVTSATWLQQIVLITPLITVCTTYKYHYYRYYICIYCVCVCVFPLCITYTFVDSHKIEHTECNVSSSRFVWLAFGIEMSQLLLIFLDDDCDDVYCHRIVEK